VREPRGRLDGFAAPWLGDGALSHDADIPGPLNEPMA